MKKLFAILALLAFGVAQADTLLTTGISETKSRTTDQYSTTANFHIFQDVAKDSLGNVQVDGLVTNAHNRTTQAITNGYEIGATQFINTGTFATPYVRLGYGIVEPSGHDNSYYTSGQVGTMISTGTPVSGFVDVTRGMGVQGSTGLGFTQYRTAVSYALSKADSISLRRDWFRNDIKADMYTVTYGHSF